MQPEALARRLQEFEAQGVEIVDPRQTFIGEEVRLDRVRPGATLHPGTRLHGARTLIASGAAVGVEGPATLRDAVFGPGASIASGYVEGAVLLAGASIGFGGHVRPGTLMEEESSTAHCVGLKHTILMSFVTLGSLINFCDCLMAGGTSRRDHSEVGSGFIHFNYTPWGAKGDKATPSLIGDVPRGVFLRERRIFLGGTSGLVGPGRVGYGAITGAGQVVRKPVGEGRLSLQPIRDLDVERSVDHLDKPQPRGDKNVAYIGNLVALRRWYQDVRLARATDAIEREVLVAAVETLDLCIAERVKRLGAFLAERGVEAPTLNLQPVAACPLDVQPTDAPHVAWVQGLDDATATAGVNWLQGLVTAVAG
ncbi:MAG: UDP-N-acetylglucosamine pyrophosphorylase [Myxococcota bacterium]